VLRTAVGLVAGAGSALRTPGWVEGPRLAELMRAPSPASSDAAAPRGAVRAAVTLVQVLARLPRSRWLNTCLYRSVAECLVLRRFGVPAVLRIGVRSEAGAIAAHAWVVRADRADAGPSPDGHEPLVLRA
jgi:Transglutaminase-like superfamily